MKDISHSFFDVSEFDWQQKGLVHDAYKTNTLQYIHTFFSPFIMEEYQSNGVKEEGKENSLTSEKKELNRDEKYWEKYQNNVLPAIKQALKDDWLNVRFVLLN